MLSILGYYLLAGVLACIAFYCYGIVGDIVRGPDHKFGYNYKNPLFWLMCAVWLVPILNLWWLWFWLGPKPKSKQY